MVNRLCLGLVAFCLFVVPQTLQAHDGYKNILLREILAKVEAIAYSIAVFVGLCSVPFVFVHIAG